MQRSSFVRRACVKEARRTGGTQKEQKEKRGEHNAPTGTTTTDERKRQAEKL